jgi:nitrous oxidase accessory protein NosD
MRNPRRFGWLVILIIVVGLQALPRAGSQPAPPPVRVIDAGQSPNLQAAFDALPATGGVVRIPPGEYRITQPLMLTRGETRIEGSGAATKILNLNQDGHPAIIVQPLQWETDQKTRIWRVQLADFRICGDPQAVDAKSTQPKSGDALLCQGVQELFISGLSIDHHGGDGIHLVDCYEDPRISDSLITYCRQTGVHIENCHDIVVNANQFEENQDALRCVDSFNLCMNGNNIDDHLGNGVIIENTYGSVVSGNMIEECDGTAIILDRDCYGIALSSNVIAHHQKGGIDLRDAHGCTVSANNFVLCNQASLMIGPDSGRIAVTGNAFVNSDIGGQTKRPREHQNAISRDLAYGVQLEGTADITLTGNVFGGLRDAALTTRGDCRRLVLVGNSVTDVAQDNAERQPWDLSAAKDAVVANNHVPQP